MTDPQSAQPGSWDVSGPEAESGDKPWSAAGSDKASARPDRPGAGRPAGWFPPPTGEAAPPVRLREPARSDAYAVRPGSPAPEHSGWRLAQRVWQDSGVSWENSPSRSDQDDHYAAENDPYAAAAYTDAPHPAGPYGWYGDDQVSDPRAEGQQAAEWEAAGQRYPDWEAPGPLPRRRPAASWDAFPPGDFSGLPYPRDHAPAPAPAAASSVPPAFAAREFAAPLGAPVSLAEPVTLTDAPSPATAQAPPRTEPDELFRAWQGSVREATGRSVPWAGLRAGRLPARRGRGRQAIKIGVPAVVIVTVGAGALLMLTGRANEMLAERASTGAVSSATPGFSASVSPVSSSLPGYPGGPGTVSVAAMWSSDGAAVAVGAADGHPAVWRRAPAGVWSLVPAASLGGVAGHLTSVTHGPRGWVAVGSVVVNGQAAPALYQSSDGVTWTRQATLTALAGAGAQFLGVSASSGGYVVVGQAASGTHSFAAMWSSADLMSWAASGNSANAGSFGAAVVSVGSGFAAVGSELNCHTIWTSADGRHWTAHDLAKPDGATSATLRSVTAGAGGQIVAGGYAVTSGGDIPLVVASADDGAHLTQVVLSSPDGPATVTAVTAAGGGFVAVGLAGTASQQHAVTWTSKDGLAWSSATSLSAAGSSEITALTATGTGTGQVVTGTVQHGTATDLLTVPAP
jgi:hypothetical protein